MVGEFEGRVIYAKSGGRRALVHLRGQDVVGQEFDTDSGKLSGTVALLAAGAARAQTSLIMQTVSAVDGVLAWNGGGSGGERQLTVYDRSGKRVGGGGPPGIWLYPSVSPNGDKAVVRSLDARERLAPIYVVDLKTGYATRLTFHKLTAWHPLWSGDGRSIAYGLSAGIGKTDVMVRNLVDGSERRLWEGDRANWLQDWSRDGRLLLFAAAAPNRVRGAHLYALPINEAGKAGAPYLVVQTEGGVWGRISPDGKWLVYCTDESGEFELFVRRMPRAAGEEPGAKWPIGSSGVDPKWSADGSKIYYVALDRRRLMEVDVKTGEGFEAQPPRVLFEATFLFDRTDRNAYDVTRDGRFVVSTLAGSNLAPVHVMLNWHRMLERS